MSKAVYRRYQRIDRIIITCPYEQLDSQREWLHEHGYRIVDTERQLERRNS
jgi:ribosome modulation factor